MLALITQRESVNVHGVRVDLLESTYVSYFESLGFDLMCVSNFHTNLTAKMDRLPYDLVIMTGGGSVPIEYLTETQERDFQAYRDRTEQILIRDAVKKGKPILGICRGMQFINGFFGGKVSPLKKLNVSRKIGIDHRVKFGAENILVNHYHNDGVHVKNLAPGFAVVAEDEENCVVECFYSEKYRALGFQWHPDRTFSEASSFHVTAQLIRKFVESGGHLD